MTQVKKQHKPKTNKKPLSKKAKILMGIFIPLGAILLSVAGFFTYVFLTSTTQLVDFSEAKKDEIFTTLYIHQAPDYNTSDANSFIEYWRDYDQFRIEDQLLTASCDWTQQTASPPYMVVSTTKEDSVEVQDPLNQNATVQAQSESVILSFKDTLAAAIPRWEYRATIYNYEGNGNITDRWVEAKWETATHPEKNSASSSNNSSEKYDGYNVGILIFSNAYNDYFNKDYKDIIRLWFLLGR